MRLAGPGPVALGSSGTDTTPVPILPNAGGAFAGVEQGAAATPAHALIQVACGVLINARGDVLLAQRPEGKIAAGWWEFPGGKIEADETPLQALRRELLEELAIDVSEAAPLMRFRHDYSNRSVVLDTWRVTQWVGEPRGCEGQTLCWLPGQRFAEVSPLLPTVVPIERALCTPLHYVFTPPQLPLTALLAGLAGLPPGSWLRLRQPALDDAQYEAIAAALVPAAQAKGLVVILDRDPRLAQRLGADGWHARSAALMQLEARPELPLAVASAHNSAELAQAARLGFDAAVLGPVCATPTHPGATVLGWSGFSAVRGTAALPVFAIGGLSPSALVMAAAHNAQGIAGISAYWT